jgi:LysR family pca operon transcriptional activator
MARYLNQLLKMRQLRIVDALWHYGSVSGASRALRLSQPALTKALQEIEKTVGAQIYERHARGVRPTEAGHALIETSHRVLAEVARLDEELDRIGSGSAGSLAVGAFPAPAVGLLPKVIARLRAECSKLQIRIVEGSFEDLGPALSVGEVDLIVGRLYDPPVPDDFIREVLFDDPVVFLARADHVIFENAEPSAADVAKFELIIPPVGRLFGQELDKLVLRLAEFRPMFVRSTSIGFTREVVHATTMIALAPALIMAADILRGTIRIVPLNMGFPARPSGVIYRADRPLVPAAHQFIAALKETIKTMLPIGS